MSIARRHFLHSIPLLLACSRRLSATPHVDDGDAPPPACTRTADNIEGPFYKRNAPHRARLASATDDGERLVLTGTVQSTRCAAIAGAVLDIWHANHRGDYDQDGFGFRGQVTTDANGCWRVDTIVPGRYLNGRRHRPAHLHVKLRAAGRPALTTQLYFADDPYLVGDPFVVESLVMRHHVERATRRASYDFVL